MPTAPIIPGPSGTPVRTIPTRLLFRRTESALMLGISLRKLDAYIASGQLKVKRLGGNTLIHFETLAAFASEDQGVPA